MFSDVIPKDYNARIVGYSRFIPQEVQHSTATSKSLEIIVISVGVTNFSPF